MADHKSEEEHGQELGKPDEAEKERTARERVHMPADGDGQHLIGDGGLDERAQRNQAKV